MMRNRFGALISTLIAVVPFVSSEPASAFGLRTHLFIGEEILADAADCELSFKDKSQAIPDEVCEALKNHPGAFLAGTIGPDAFPDIVIGQSYIHPGAENGRKSADWFEIMLQSAQIQEEIAFAYGNLVHASSDIFAHSYVNNYAGGVFEILESRDKDIELRHFILEKYIDQRLDFVLRDEIELEVPSKFVVDTLIETNFFSDGFRLEPGGLLEALNDPGGTVGKAFFSRLSSAKAASHAILMHAALELARAAKRDLPCEAVAAEAEMIAAHRAYLLAEAQARSVSGVENVTLSLPEVPAKPDCSQEYSEGTLNQMLTELEEELDFQVASSSVFELANQAVDARIEFWTSVDPRSRSNLRSAYEAYQRAVEKRNEMRALAVFSQAWAAEVELASQAYVEAGLDTALLMVENSQPHPPALHERASGGVHYELWVECYLPVFFGQPFASGAAKCQRLEQMGESMSLSSAAQFAGMGKMPRNFAYRVIDWNRRLDAFFLRLARSGARLVAPSTVDLLEQIYEPTRITRERMNEVFARGRNGQLEFECITDWIDVDLGMITPPEQGTEPLDLPCREIADTDRADFLDPDAFVPLVHAVTLGKVALLSREGVAELANSISGSSEVASSIQTSPPFDWHPRAPRRNAQRYSAILDTPISLDGSYQWQGEGMPYPRRRRYTGSEDQTASGYPIATHLSEIVIDGSAINSNRRGFPYYQTFELRERVFSILFAKPFEGRILYRSEMQPPHYPFRPCAGDPFRPFSQRAEIEKCNTVGE